MIKFIKKSEVSRRESMMIRAFAVLLALLVCSLFIMFLSLSPFEVYRSMLKGAFGSAYKTKATIIKAIPLLITALGISVAFKMKFWNIGGEGQIVMGAFASSFVALKLTSIPKFAVIPVMLVAGVLGGAAWAIIPALLKSKLRTNETIITLMMNYIALKWITFLQYGPWKDPKAKGFPKIPDFPEAAVLPKVLGIHVGWIFALLLVVLIYVFMNHTKKGYEISVLGESEKTAVYAGININKTIITAMVISGGLCGLVGMIQASAVNNTLSMQVSGGVGFTAIIVAWLSQLNSFAALIVAILFAMLVEGGTYIQTAFNIPEAAALIIQALILFFVLGSEFFIKYKLVFSNKYLTNHEFKASRTENKFTEQLHIPLTAGKKKTNSCAAQGNEVKEGM
jgi:simple sugar transport system permease protein